MTVQGAVSVRAAQPEDLDAVTNLALTSLPADPAWPYRYPYAEQFPDEHYKYTRIRYAEYLENVQAGIYAAMVAELPSKNDPLVREIVAISMWQLPEIFSETGNAIKPPADFPDRPDANFMRMKTFRKVLGEQKKAVFDAVYGDKQLNLMVLATHPDYQRRGAGTALLDWGKQKAKEEDLKLTLFSSPQGYKLYHKMGFQEVGVTHIQVEGEEELLDLPMMVF